MVKFQYPIFIADKNMGGATFSEESLKKIVSKFVEIKKEIPIVIRTSPSQLMPIGKITELSYNDLTKQIFATIELAIAFGAGGTPIQELETPTGKRILEFDFLGLEMKIGL